MKQFLLLFLAPTYLFCQEDSDSLKKYSYYIDGINLEDSMANFFKMQGTGFFVKKDNILSLKTAKHVFGGCDYFGSTINKLANHLLVFYNDSLGLTFKDFKKPWRITTPDLKKIVCSPTYKYPDTISVVKEDSNLVYSIEKISLYDPVLIYGEIVIYGFPLYNNIKDGGFISRTASQIITKDYALDSLFRIEDKRGFLVTDTVNYRIYSADFKITPKLMGFSGSPVFIRNLESRRWHFLGTMSAIDSKLNAIFVVKHQYVIR